MARFTKYRVCDEGGKVLSEAGMAGSYFPGQKIFLDNGNFYDILSRKEGTKTTPVTLVVRLPEKPLLS